MINEKARSDALEFYARIGASLFPIPRGSKDPTGIVSSFAHDFSHDPAQWCKWAAEHPGCNFGLVAGPSNLVICDVDLKDGRDAAWASWVDLCHSWGIEPIQPTVQSARGGWHILLKTPADVDARSLRQPDAVRGKINVRAGNGYVVAAGSFYDGTTKGEQSGPYVLLNDGPLQEAPAALIAHCTRRSSTNTNSGAGIGTTDPSSIRDLVEWLVENKAIETYEDWISCGMVCALEAGAAGLDIWALTCHNGVADDGAMVHWRSFATDTSRAGADNLQKIGSLLHRAKKMGWKGNLRASAEYMFRDITQKDVFGKPVNVNPAPTSPAVAQIAEQAGATLASAAPMPLMEAQRIIASLGEPILDNFLAGTRDTASRAYDPIKLPDVLNTHPLFNALNDSISRALAMVEAGQFRQSRVLQMLAVLYAVHSTVCENVTQRITASGGVISPGQLDSAIKNFEWRVRVETNTAAGFILDSKGRPAPENSDNVHVFVRQRGIKLRWNAWNDYAEVSDADRDAFAQLTDHVFGDLLMDAENSQFEYHPSEGRFRRGLISNARRTMFDPLLDRLDILAANWDRQKRLDTWLTNACGVPPDAYHTAVGRNLIGGMIRRARHPGCVHSETVIFISPDQGTGKSTLTKILALSDDWHTDSLKLGGRQQDIIPQMDGKWVIELGELAGMNKADVEDIKQFISATADNYTKKYEAFATDHKRRCVFIGTSNDRRPLQDATGNRRFLPVHVRGEVNLAWMRENVEQLIGEAAALESAGEVFGLPREVWLEANRHQEAARAMSPVEELCFEWFDRPPGAYFITASDIGRALKMAGHKGRYAGFMDKLGWRDRNLVVPMDGRKCRVWVRHDNDRLSECVRLVPQQTQVNGPVEMRMQIAVHPV